MSRFDAMMESIFAPASPEEAKERKMAYPEVMGREWLEEFLRRNDVTRNPDGSYDVKGDVDLDSVGLVRLPVRFGVVKGCFDCYDNMLTSLEGAPKEVGKYFSCTDNMLTSLEGAPEKVGWSFSCCYNNLTSLEGAPKEVGAEFWCKNMKNGVKFTKREVSAVCEVGEDIYV